MTATAEPETERIRRRAPMVSAHHRIALANYFVDLASGRCPNEIIEAQTAPVLVATTVVGGAEEAGQEGVAGWVVQNPSPRAIAKTLIDALYD